MKKPQVFRAALAVCAFLLSAAAAAQPAFPSHPIRIVTSSAAGGGVDAVARFFCEQLGASMGQPCFVENRPGGNSLIGTMAVRQAPADGYTVLLGGNSPMAVSPVLLKELPYDALKDFKPLTGLTRHTNVLIVPLNSPYKSVADLVEAGKKSGKGLNAGVYAPLYELVTAWLANASGARLTEIRYKGLSQMLVDLIAGQLDFAFVDLAPVSQQINQGQLRALAVMNETSHPDFPNVPAMKSTYPDMVNYSWTGLFVRTSTPADVTRTLADAMQKVVRSQAARDFVKKYNLELLPFAPAEMREFQQKEIGRFEQIRQAANIEKQ